MFCKKSGLESRIHMWPILEKKNQRTHISWVCPFFKADISLEIRMGVVPTACTLGTFSHERISS
jgi:hypothetical protein